VATASIGIAFGLGGSPEAADVLRAADSALHRAKASGRGRHAVFEPSMHWRAMTSLKLENDLRRALDRQELRLAYQPIVSLRDGELVGFEALLRWRHPERGSLPPSEFVRIAEESGLILPLGEWVLREACRSGRSWRDRFGQAPPISVTVSGRQIAQPGLVESVSAILADTGMDERHLGLEITESAIIDNAVAAQDNLARLRALSIRISVDDFGTGHSCLSRLHTFPVDALKVDRSFIARMDARRGARETVRAIVALARDLQLEVVAEGVETVEQREALESLDCSFGQGFLFAQAVEADEAEAMIEGGQRFL
jgi:EAL domain-containing protein (putative c-di-GMP-specific phosphodiesterase class I)